MCAALRITLTRQTVTMATPPPGLEGFASVQVSTRGGSGKWFDLPPVKLYTVSLIIKSGKILLGYKKRGFGKDMYNGFGGKVEPGESVEAAALRELKEEAGISAKLVPCGMILYFSEGTDHTFQIEVFRADDYEGEPVETDEMRPEWFDLPDSVGQNAPIPWEKMWADDQHWYPIVLSGRCFVGRADFEESVQQDGVKRYTLQRWWFGAKDT